MEIAELEGLGGEYVAVNGVNIRYVVKGSGSPLVLIHGFGEFLDAWWRNIGPLSQHHRVYAMDLPGHGWSDKPAVDYSLAFATEIATGFVQALGIGRASLVGHSLGGMVGMSIALNSPDAVDRLILVDSAGLTDNVSLLYRFFRVPFLGELLVEPTVKAGIRRRMRQAFYNPDLVTEAMIERDYQSLKMPGAKKVMLSIIRHGIGLRGLNPETVMLDRLHLIRSPTLLIHGAHDKIIPADYSRRAAELIPNARLKIIEECGHCPYIEKADEFNEAVIAFLPGW